MHVAALGSLLIHAALLSLPLGGVHKERGVPVSAAGAAIRAFLRPEVAEPARSPEPVEPAAATQPPVAPTPAREDPDVKPEPKAEPDPAPAGGAPVSTAAIPATFLDPSQLTEKPKPLKEPPVDLLLPILARPGVARLVLYIDELGRVTSVEVDSATLPPAAVGRAVAIFAAVRFSPGRVDGTAVKTKVRITVGAEERAKEN